MADAGTQVCCSFLWSDSGSIGETVSSGLCDHPCIPNIPIYAILYVLKNPKYPFIHPFTLLSYFKLPKLRRECPNYIESCPNYIESWRFKRVP